MKRLFAVSAAIAVVLTGCSTSAAGGGGATLAQGTKPALAVIDAAPVEDLIGIWRVSDAEGESADTWVRFADEVVVWTDCGISTGNWRAGDGLFVALLDSSYGGSCTELDDLPNNWLIRATGYGYIDGELSLVDGDGERLATLTEDGLPPSEPEDDDEYRNDPGVDDLQSSLESEVAPLPAGATPVEALVGRWVPASYEGDDQPYFEVRADGSYSTHEGCDGGEGGRWSASPDGRLLTVTFSVVLAVACVRVDGKPEPDPTFVTRAPNASLIGMVGDELTFYSADGTKIGALIRG